MKPRERKFVLVLELALLALVGCLGHNQARDPKRAGLSERQVFERIRLGMTRLEVEKAVGRPVAQGADMAFYGTPPRIQAWESARTPYSVTVVYSTNNIVAYKGFDDGTNLVREGDMP
jgi:hypothetical protein